MRFLFIALGALAAFALAQENPFSIPEEGFEFEAGTPTTITWDPTTDGTITIKLQKGNNITPSSGIILGAGLPNSGSFSWVPDSDLPAGSDYTIQIISDEDPDVYNFTPRFNIDGATGTGSLPTATGSMTPTRTRSATTETESSQTTSAPTSASTETETEMETSTTSESSSTMTTATPTSTPTRAPSPDDDSEEDGAMSLTLPTGLLSIVLALMAFL